VKLLFLNQTFYPDCVATAQLLQDVAAELAQEGHQVTVVTSQRAYDNPAKRFAIREQWRGVDIRRIRSSGLGKGAKWRRAVDFAIFLLSCCFKLLTLPRHNVVVALTSPPLISLLGALYAKWHKARFFYWIMDLNPDEAVAAGWLKPNSFVTRVMERLSRFSMRTASKVIALDRFMADRVATKGIPREKILVLPPWSHDEQIQADAQGRKSFRKAHGLHDKFVVMYSGNHSPCHPLDTLLQAALHMSPDHVPSTLPGRGVGVRVPLAFLFIGGGSEFAKVQRFADEHKLTNIICLPYQPLDQLSASLSAADLQVVVMGEAFVGTIHPCKIYNILRIATSVLYIGPRTSHISDIFGDLEGNPLCRWAAHGDVESVIKHIHAAASECPQPKDDRFGPLAASFSRQNLLPQLIAALTDLSPLTSDSIPVTAATSHPQAHDL